MLKDTNIISTLKSKELGWADHGWGTRGQLIEEVTKWTPENKKLLGRPWQKWVVNVKKDLNMLGKNN